MKSGAVVFLLKALGEFGKSLCFWLNVKKLMSDLKHETGCVYFINI